MCNQAVSLVAAELERRGIATVTIQLLKEAAEKVRPPRALLVPYRHGYPLGAPADSSHQHEVIEAALALLEDSGLETPALVPYQDGYGQGSTKQ